MRFMATQILTVDFFLSRENYPRTRLVIDSIAQSQGHVMKNQKVPQVITLAFIFHLFFKVGNWFCCWHFPYQLLSVWQVVQQMQHFRHHSYYFIDIRNWINYFFENINNAENSQKCQELWSENVSKLAKLGDCKGQRNTKQQQNSIKIGAY